ncbi:penicillin acylase family protein [Mucilaginibacter ginsenosidivorans]|uniref:Penicillin acylase family protein n=1 Tax=Mucilaginibacter ginsenosidivorans TaxID=398053 RepID=A0A5B8UXT7_9SPHI|nr:penicillin acylase family protein [Mucilaginibacter ginsenosidivorans]QEC63854.1 penicillin acylase family protein [Mucilaginibacter ginsenosidivorans]
MKYLAILVFAVTLGLIYSLQIKIGDIPPLGKLLNPGTGFWQNAESKNTGSDEQLQLDGLTGKVVIHYDEHRIPHIFAENDHDLYYAQGYITAHDRLWEMDIQTRSASGRLSEVVGVKALEVDRYHRRIGMTYGAENTLRGMMKNPVSKMMIGAYSDGVNSFIHHLSKKDYPLEFKLLDYAPEEWKPIDCAYLLKLMSETLAGGSDDFAMTNDLKVFGAKDVNDLFPDYPFHEDPIIPAGTKWDFKALPLPKPSADFIAQMTGRIKPKERIPGIGSNNWAIAGSKSANGYPILANDPHLNLTFPSIWYQVQLSSPTVNVYGVSLPGAPCVVVGYNQNISWGVTNVGADVLDWYQVKFRDNTKNEYWYNNKWKKTSKHVEVINVRGQKPLYDTVIYTHHGPVVYNSTSQKPEGDHENVPVGDALRWIAHDESDEFMTFYLLNRGKNYDDYRKALTFYTAPAQNFIFADKEKDIAITPNGKFPLKFREQGKYILDGSDPANDWQGWIPYDQNPTVKNPARGFVSSANQSSTDQTYPYYINWDFELYDRAKRINDLLSGMKNATADSMRLMQMDDYSMRAHDVLPEMLEYIDASKFNKDQKWALELVRDWDKRFSANSEGASIFNAWWLSFYDMVWDEFDRKDILLNYPSFDRTEKLLLTEPGSKWFDVLNTPGKETCTGIVNRSFTVSVSQLIKTHGKPGKNWEWGNVKDTHINHLANLPGFGTGHFSVGGNGSVINALKGGNGPSWRMVVQLGPEVKGYGVFPGGESGNPGSFYYDDMFETWRDGKLNELLFLKNINEKSARIKSTLILSSK